MTGQAPRPKLAVWKFASCDGCQLTLLDCEDELLALAAQVEIAHQVREILTEVLPGGPTGVEVAVHNGVVTLTGEPELAADNDLVQIAVRLTRDVDGVVEVLDKTSPAAVPALR